MPASRPSARCSWSGPSASPLVLLYSLELVLFKGLKVSFLQAVGPCQVHCCHSARDGRCHTFCALAAVLLCKLTRLAAKAYHFSHLPSICVAARPFRGSPFGGPNATSGLGQGLRVPIQFHHHSIDRAQAGALHLHWASCPGVLPPLAPPLDQPLQPYACRRAPTAGRAVTLPLRSWYTSIWSTCQSRAQRAALVPPPRRLWTGCRPSGTSQLTSSLW